MKTMLCLVLIACGGRTYTGSGVTGPQRDEPGLADGRAFIPYARAHYDEWDDDGGIIKYFSNDAARSGTTTTKHEHIGVVVLDLRSGACKLEKRASGRARSPWASGRVLQGEHQTPSGAFVSRDGGRVLVRDAKGRRPLVPDPKAHALWIPDTDAIVLDSRLIDVVDSDSFTFAGGIARLGGQLFLPTQRGVTELSGAPIAHVADHVPKSLLPEADVQWLGKAPWVVGKEIGDAKLVREGSKVILERPDTRILLGENVDVTVFDDRYVVGDGILVDLKEREIVASAPKVTRIGKWGGYLHLDSNGTRFRAPERLAWIRPFDPDLRILGVDGATIVMHTYAREAIFVFDLATRTWRELSYQSCVPKK